MTRCIKNYHSREFMCPNDAGQYFFCESCRKEIGTFLPTMGNQHNLHTERINHDVNSYLKLKQSQTQLRETLDKMKQDWT